MKILNLDPWNYSDVAKVKYRELGNYKEVEKITREELAREVTDVDIIIIRLSHRLDSEVLQYAKQLKFIVTNCTGLDHIDLEFCCENQVRVISLRGEYDFLRNIHATAELTWGLILSAVRKIGAAQNHVSNEKGWSRNLFFGNELHGKTIGILGVGRIGEKIASYAKCFGMNVKAYDPKPLSKPENVEFVNSINALFSDDLDILSIHVNYKEETHGLVDERLLRQLKSSVTIVNTSRGAIVDEQAIATLLEMSKLGCYATDVLEHETSLNFLEQNCLIKAQKAGANVVITPHIGGVTYESWHRTEEYCVDKLISMLEDETL
jgi:D-3-phosphoglycerate dehydrogenase